MFERQVFFAFYVDSQQLLQNKYRIWRAVFVDHPIIKLASIIEVYLCMCGQVYVWLCLRINSKAICIGFFQAFYWNVSKIGPIINLSAKRIKNKLRTFRKISSFKRTTNTRPIRVPMNPDSIIKAIREI